MPQNNGRLGLSLINRFKKRKIVTATGAVDLIAPAGPATAGYDTNPRRLNTALTGAAEVAVVVQATNPKEVATTGKILVQRDGGALSEISYTSFTSTATTITFTIGATDFSGASGTATALASAQNLIYLPLSVRCVLTAWTVTGQNTNAAVTTFVVRNKTTTANILFGGAMLATTGTCNIAQQDRFAPGTAGETIELNVAGAITGQLEVEIEGGFLPSSTPCVNEYTGVP